MTSFSAKIDLASKFPVGDMSVVRWLATCNRRCSGVPLDFCCCPLPGCWSHCRRCICTCAQSERAHLPRTPTVCRMQAPRSRAGGHWSTEAATFVQFLVRLRARRLLLGAALVKPMPQTLWCAVGLASGQPLSRQLPGRSRSSSARDASVRPINCQVHLIGQAQAACFFNLHRARRPQADWLSHPSAPTPTRFWSCRLPA